MANKSQLQKIRQNLLAIRKGATPSEMSERIRDLCNVNGYDPVYEMMNLIREGELVITYDSDGNELKMHKPLPAATQIRIHESMMKYIYPTLKSVDVQGEINANVTVTVKNYPQPFQGHAESVDADFSIVGEVVEKVKAKAKAVASG